MRRDLAQFTRQTFDVLVVGGGVYGLTIAYDAAQRGLSVALIERNDFGSGTSFNHLRTIHGGLRYLQTFDLARARESVRERRTLARIAPAAVRPLPFVLPLPRSLLRGPLAMRAGFLLDRFIGRDRNDGVLESHLLPNGRVIGRAEAIERFPATRSPHLTGAAIWYDYVTTEADRLTLSWGIAAASHGAVLANYVEATALAIEGGRTIGVHALDRQHQRALEVHARVTVNATGGAVDRLLDGPGIALGLPMLKAMNVVTARDAPAAAIGGRSPTGRTLFLVPWKNRALFGTWESARSCAPDNLSISGDDVAAFLTEINHAFPWAALTAADVTLVHRGVVPAVVHADGRARLEGHEQVRDHADRGVEGLISVAGTKYTTARAVAEHVTDRLCAKLGRPGVPCRTATEPLPHSDLSGDALLVQAARDEMVLTLEDALVRRTPLGALGCPPDSALSHAANIVGDVLGWDPQKKAGEIDAVRRFYGTLNAWKT